jgi:pyruvate dehydrogenase E2 component (dihydrolipoamide acetyltransferase)
MRDGLAIRQVPAYSISLEADMTKARATLDMARSLGVRLTYTHLAVRAAALALAQNGELHHMICGNRRYHPAHVDIGLSVAGDEMVAPVVVIEAADEKNVLQIAREIVEGVPVVVKADRAMMKAVDRWGFLAPLAFLRRAILGTLFRSFEVRRKVSGTFQVSVLAEVDQFSSPMFSTSGALFVPRVRDKAVVRNGEIVIRPVVTLTCCADHRVWDGRAGQRFLTAVRDILESDRFLAELDQRV